MSKINDTGSYKNYVVGRLHPSLWANGRIMSVSKCNSFKKTQTLRLFVWPGKLLNDLKHCFMSISGCQGKLGDRLSHFTDSALKCIILVGLFSLLTTDLSTISPHRSTGIVTVIVRLHNEANLRHELPLYTIIFMHGKLHFKTNSGDFFNSIIICKCKILAHLIEYTRRSIKRQFKKVLIALKYNC